MWWFEEGLRGREGVCGELGIWGGGGAKYFFSGPKCPPRQSRLKISISLGKFNPDLQNLPTKIGVWWVARLKFSISLENFDPGGRFLIFQSSGP